MNKANYLAAVFLSIAACSSSLLMAQEHETNGVFRIEAVLSIGTPHQHHRVLEVFESDGVEGVSTLPKDEGGNTICFPIVMVGENSSLTASNYYAFVQYTTEFTEGFPLQRSFQERGLGEYISVAVNSVKGNMVSINMTLDHSGPPTWSKHKIGDYIIHQPTFPRRKLSNANLVLYNNAVVKIGGIVNTSSGEDTSYFIRLSKQSK